MSQPTTNANPPDHVLFECQCESTEEHENNSVYFLEEPYSVDVIYCEYITSISKLPDHVQVIEKIGDCKLFENNCIVFHTQGTDSIACTTNIDYLIPNDQICKDVCYLRHDYKSPFNLKISKKVGEEIITKSVFKSSEKMDVFDLKFKRYSANHIKKAIDNIDTYYNDEKLDITTKQLQESINTLKKTKNTSKKRELIEEIENFTQHINKNITRNRVIYKNKKKKRNSVDKPLDFE